MDKQEILENYSRRLSSSGNTRALYLRWAGDFLNHVDGELDREAVQAYIRSLKRKGRSDGTIDFAFRVVRTLFRRNNIEWPFSRGESPQIREDKVLAPALDPEVVVDMIHAVKAEGTGDERGFLAVSTMYGTRAVEMLALGPDDVDLKGKTIHIATAKHGRERTHIVPDEIVDSLAARDWSQEYSNFRLFSLWYQVERRIDIKHVNQVGWHSIRRTLDSLLLDQLPQVTVEGFLRWKQRTSSNMAFRYSAQRFVGRDGVTTKVIGEARDVDSKVFAVHPFLKEWA